MAPSDTTAAVARVSGVPTGRSRPSLRPSPARREAERIVRQALVDGREPTAAEVASATSRSARQARRLVAQARRALGQEWRPDLAVVDAADIGRPWPDPASPDRGGIA